MPTRRLATFGATQISYHLVSSTGPERRTRLRQGTVRSERPQILTPQSFVDRFQGFGEEARDFAQWINSAYRDVLRALEYNFKNQGFETRVISQDSADVAARIQQDLDSRDERLSAVIRCPDPAWSLALMKFTMDEASRSFPGHVRDLDRRGLFDPEGRSDSRRRREIDELFSRAASSPDAKETLGAKLRDYGLWPEYEDRFLGLF